MATLATAWLSSSHDRHVSMHTYTPVGAQGSQQAW